MLSEYEDCKAYMANYCHVLILIILEDALWVLETKEVLRSLELVLILIILEDALWEQMKTTINAKVERS